MGYRNKTYVIFDGDQDMWAYRFMLGWKALEHLDFDFHDAHDLNTITDRANEETVKRKLRERFANAKQVIVIVGLKTKNLFRFVRWELDVALDLKLPIIVANLNGKRSIDPDLCPPILKGKDAIHVAFKMKILKYAMDHFVEGYPTIYAGQGDDWHFKDEIYTRLEL
jgi:hypothetical protein